MAQVNPGRFVATNVTLYRLITLAYGKHCRLSQEQELISGGPEWRQSVAFDIQATLPEGSPVYTQQQLNNGEAPKLQAMLQKMLADRFGLALHRETKEIPVYNLVLVKMGRAFRADRVARLGRTLKRHRLCLNVVQHHRRIKCRVEASASLSIRRRGWSRYG